MIDPSQPGFWIVEGFASMIADCTFDPKRQTWELGNPYSGDLEMVARAKSDAILDWKRVFELSQIKFHELGLKPKHRMVYREHSWWLASIRRSQNVLRTGFCCGELLRSARPRQTTQVCEGLLHARRGLALNGRLVRRRVLGARSQGVRARARTHWEGIGNAFCSRPVRARYSPGAGNDHDHRNAANLRVRSKRTSRRVPPPKATNSRKGNILVRVRARSELQSILPLRVANSRLRQSAGAGQLAQGSILWSANRNSPVSLRSIRESRVPLLPRERASQAQHGS